MPVLNGEYVSPYGKPQGLAARLLEWAERMANDRSLPWAGLGIIEDIKLAAKFLNSREFLEHLRVHGDGEQARFAQELLDTVDTVDTTTSTRWPNLNAGKPIPSPTEWRALEQRASSFRLR